MVVPIRYRGNAIIIQIKDGLCENSNCNSHKLLWHLMYSKHSRLCCEKHEQIPILDVKREKVSTTRVIKKRLSELSQKCMTLVFSD